MRTMAEKEIFEATMLHRRKKKRHARKVSKRGVICNDVGNNVVARKNDRRSPIRPTCHTSMPPASRGQKFYSILFLILRTWWKKREILSDFWKFIGRRSTVLSLILEMVPSINWMESRLASGENSRRIIKNKDMKEKNDKFPRKNAKESSLAQFCTPRTRLHASDGKEKKRTKGRIGANYADFYRSNNFHETDDSSVSNFR